MFGTVDVLAVYLLLKNCSPTWTTLVVRETEDRVAVRTLEFSVFGSVWLWRHGVFEDAELLAALLQVRRSLAAVVASVTARTRETFGQNVQ